MVHIYNVCLLRDFVATLRLSALPSALYFFFFVQASTVTTSLQQLLTLHSLRLNVCFMFHISVPIFHYSCHITVAKGEVGIP